MGAAPSADADARYSVAEPPADVFACVLAALRRDWVARANVRFVCRGWARLAAQEPTWRAMCGFLHAEYPIAVPATLAGAPSWHALFLATYPASSRLRPALPRRPRAAPLGACDERERDADWDAALLRGGALGDAPPEDEAPPAAVAIEVCVRFRPPGLDGLPSAREAAGAPAVVVPLHQRLQLLRARHGCSAADAARRLWGAAAADADPWATASVAEAHAQVEPSAEDASESSSAPPPSTAADGAAAATASVLSIRPHSVLCLAPSVGLREFHFRRVFPDSAGSAEVYDTAAAALVCDFLNGTSGALLAYGQTGAGKTHSLHGPDEAAACSLTPPLRAAAGVVPRAAAAVLAELQRRRALFPSYRHELWVSYVEVYGSDVRDLLSDDAEPGGAGVGAWGGVAAAALAAGAAAVRVRDVAHLEALLLAGERAKRRAATALNARSSRSHALLTLRLLQPADGGMSGHEAGAAVAPPLQSRLCIADLGGAERVKRSGAGGLRLAEAIEINLALLALQSCVAALARGDAHVPFGDSRLTMLLAGALSGDAGRVVLLLAARADASHGAETLRTLHFGEAAARAALRGAGPDGAADKPPPLAAAAALRDLDAELAAVEAAIADTECWEKGKPVGAEALRERQASLLASRRALFGEHGDEDAAADAA